ncbi:MAG: hypothetical protein EA407_05945 [Rhodobacteraceae bacterium]|nr:MAG: hypothetical protein EA407_05945 [Paracoccaceae bacterium]
MEKAVRYIFGFTLVAGLIAACATPQQTCLRAAQAELVALDREIAEAERAVARGYRMSEAVEPRTTLHICAWPREPVLFCTRHTPGASAERRPVNRAAEEARLESLRAQRPGLIVQTEAAVATCMAG